MMFFGNVHGEEGHGFGGHHPGMFPPGGFQPHRWAQEPGFFRGFFRPVVLLLLAEQPMHGYELMGRIKEFGIGQGGMDPSILYRLLRFLERGGLAESALDDTGAGPARKVYSLTPEGREVLDLWAASMDDVAGFLHRFKERYRKLAP